MRTVILVMVALVGVPREVGAQSQDPALPAVSLKSGEAQLLVDDHLIAWQSDVRRTLHQPTKDQGGNEPLLAIEDEFGETASTLEANGTIVHDTRLNRWVMFALAFASNWPGESADRVRMYRFTSHDALHWIKGDQGTPQRIEFDLFDPSSQTSATNIDLFSCMYDETDEDHPYKGWLFFANWGPGREGTYYVESADGIHWTRGAKVLEASSRTIEQDGRTLGGTGDVTTFHPDPESGRFLGCLRFSSVTDVENSNRLRSRGFVFADRLDQPIDLRQVTRLGLVPAAAARNGDLPTDEYYSSTAWRYGGLWLGGLRIWHSKDHYPYSASGSAFLKLVVSHDGLNWSKVPFQNQEGIPEVFIGNGPEGGNDARNDGGYMTEFSNSPLRIGDELVYYYGCSSWGKNHPRPYRVSGGGIFRARLRPDGFVSVDGGTLVTRRLKFDGRELTVNGIGPIQVEVVAPARNTYETLAEARIEGDSLGHLVLFNQDRSLRDVAADGVVQLRFTVGEGGALYSFAVQARQAQVGSAAAKTSSRAGRIKTESFDRDPGWEGIHHRSARTLEPVNIRQDFGYSPDTSHAKSRESDEPGELGGLITPASEAAYYALAIEPRSLDQPLSASGTLHMGQGGTHLLLGFFNSETLNEWRTPNTVAMRLNGRGENFFAYVEYCTSRWRAGGDTTPFPSRIDPVTGRSSLIGFPCNQTLRWTLNYDPAGNDGRGVVTATIGEHTAICNLDDAHKQDGARFTHFGILNVMKSADSSSEVWLDDISVNGGTPDTFTRDPGWEQHHNRRAYETRIVRPRCDFGHAVSNFAGGTAAGELGGLIFRGDCRFPDKMACYGDQVGPLTLARPLQAAGKIALRRGVSDSTTLFGFYNARESMRSSESQNDGLPESVLGVHVEGPSSEGFCFYPVLRTKAGGGRYAASREFSRIFPDGQSHDWRLEYDPDGAAGAGQITLTLDEKSQTFDLQPGEKERGTTFDRFGIITTWIDGNSQDVYWDDISYTVEQ